tara:strand:- start:152 stop:1066 length:915 start_codon:yes stop_codon:yes gene_type:complete
VNIKTKSSHYLIGFFLVFFAGLLWSFGVVTVKYMVNSDQYVFQYLLCRGISIALILIIFLFCKEKLLIYKNFTKVGYSGFIGGISLSIAFIGFIYSITITTAAVTLLMLAVMPFIAAALGYFFLKENLKRLTLISIIIAFIGVAIMIYNDSLAGTVLGAITGFISATGFAIYTVTIRWRPETPKFTTVFLAGVICSIFSFLMLGMSFESFTVMPIINLYLSLLHGIIVASGLILYSFGAKYLPAAELALLSLMEVVGGILWVWIPFFGINEIPSLATIIGGTIITFAVIIQAIGSKRKVLFLKT